MAPRLIGHVGAIPGLGLGTPAVPLIPSLDRLHAIAAGLRVTRLAVIVTAPGGAGTAVAEAKGLGNLFGEMADALADARERIAKLEAKGESR